LKTLWSVFTALIVITGTAILLVAPEGTAFADGRAVVTPTTGQVCLEDDSVENYITWNTTTGVYSFVDCAKLTSTTGTGKVRLQNGTQTLTDNQATKKISASFLTGQRTGAATVVLEYSPGLWQTTTIHDTVVNPSCVCSLPSGGSDRTVVVFLLLVLSWLTWRMIRARRREPNVKA
jgi:hypothetical protein